MAYTRIDDNSGLVVYGASGLGCCSQALLYDRSGVDGEPPPEWLQKAYDEGNDNEDRILAMLKEQGVFQVLDEGELKDAGYEFGEFDVDRGVDYSKQVRVQANILPGIVCRAHLDGIGEMVVVPEGWTRTDDHVGKRFVIEVKAFGDSFWEQWKRGRLKSLKNYPWQVSAQMKGAGLPCLFVVGHKDKEGKVFEIDYEFVDTLPIPWMNVIKKVSEIEKRVTDPSLDGPDCEQPFMYPCPYYRLHDVDVTGGKAGIVVLTDDNTEQAERVLLISLAEEYERHKVAEAHHKELKSKAAAGVAKWFDEHQMKKGVVKVGAWQVQDMVQNKTGGPDWDQLPEGFVVPKKPGYEVRYPVVNKADGKEDKDGGKDGG